MRQFATDPDEINVALLRAARRARQRPQPPTFSRLTELMRAPSPFTDESSHAMDKITVSKQNLLDKMKANRDAHRAIFEEAQKNFRAKVIELLDQKLAETKKGSPIKLYFDLPEPVDYTEEYDDAIARFEWHQGETIELSSAEFKQYVLDKWGWQQNFAASTQVYTVS